MCITHSSLVCAIKKSLIILPKKFKRSGDCNLNSAQYGFLLSYSVTRVPAIEREKREWAINLKCYGRKILFWLALLHWNGFLIIFL